MSEIKGIDITDVLGLSQPLTKLIEVVSAGIGKAYEPIHKRRMAKAQASEIAEISQTINRNLNLPMQYQNGSLSIDITNTEELLKRTGERILYREIQRQQNIDAIVGNAYTELEKDTTVPDDAIDKDWNFQFFEYAANVTDETMQKLWGKILAGEIRQPNNFSLRSLEKLKTVSKSEADIFCKIAEFAIISGHNVFVPNEKSLFDKYKIQLEEILVLAECGLFNADVNLSLNLYMRPNREGTLYNSQIMGRLSANSEKTVILQILLLTSAGKEIYKLLNCRGNKEFAIDYLKSLQKNDKQICITVHNIISISGSIITSQRENLLEGTNTLTT